MLHRPRRNRKSEAIRGLVRETRVHPEDLVMPFFIVEGRNVSRPVPSMPGISNLSTDLMIEEARRLNDLGLKAVALFPRLEDALKDRRASESANPEGLLPKAVEALKAALPRMCVMTDVAMDPYSSDGHDGLVENGRVLNDETLPILAGMALTQARAGADFVAPSDMMDGRVGYLRGILDEQGFTDVGLLSYAAKYCSAFYGPFRDALGSAPKSGDKKTYQMDPANRREALREVYLDISEGADMVMIKPAVPYLDVIRDVRAAVTVPVAAYHVSGEYAMLKAAGEKGWIDEDAVLTETLTSIKRAGADLIFTYAAGQYLRNNCNR